MTLPAHALSGKLTGSVATVGGLTRELQQFVQHGRSSSLEEPLIDGAAHWSATLGGTLEHPSASVAAAVNGLSIGNWKNADVQVNAKLAAATVEIQRARLGWNGHQVEMNGRVGGLAADAPLRLEGTIEGNSVGSVFENLGFAGLAEGSVSGAVHIAGTVTRPAVETTLNLGGFTLFGERFTRASLDAQWKESELRISRLQAEQNGEPGTRGRLNAHGSLDITTHQYVFSMMGQDLRPTSRGSPPVTGAFSLEANGTGTFENPTLNTRLNGKDVRIGGVNIGDLHGEINAGDHRASVRLAAPDLNVQAASTVVMERDWPFEVRVDAESARVKTNPAASFDAIVRGSGSIRAGELDRITAVVRNLRLATPGQDTISDGAVEISYADRHLRVEHLALTSGDSNLSVTGAIPLFADGAPASLSLHGRVLLDRFSTLLPEMHASNLQGVAQLSATLTRSGEHWTPTGSITIQDAGFKSQSIPLGIENVSGRFSIEDGIIRAEQLSGTMGNGTFSVAASMPLRLISNALPVPTADAGQPARFTAHADDLQFTTGTDERKATASFGVSVVAEASELSLNALQGTLDFSELRLQTAKSEFRQTAPTRISMAGGIARLESLNANGPDASLVASGSIDLKESSDSSSSRRPT